MAVYRITSFTSSDMDKAGEIIENMRDVLEGVGAEFIDLVSYDGGEGVVVAKYPDRATMEAATDVAKKAFGTCIEAGVIDGDSVNPRPGEVFKSF